jgi:hypothetical protein
MLIHLLTESISYAIIPFICPLLGFTSILPSFSLRTMTSGHLLMYGHNYPLIWIGLNEFLYGARPQSLLIRGRSGVSIAVKL